MVIGNEHPASNLDYAWQKQQIWSKTADRLKKRIELGRATALWLGIIAAVLAVVAVQIGDAAAGRWVGLAAGAAAALIPFAQRLAGKDPVEDWTRARSASEGLKTEVYSYLGGGSTYARDDRDEQLGREARAIVEAVGDLLRETGGIHLGNKDLPGVTDVETYITERVDDQIDWYAKKAFGYEGTARKLRMAGNALAAIAAFLGVVVAVLDQPSIAAWVPVVTTVGSSLLAHIAASRYDHLVIEYLRTAQRLENLRNSRVDTGMSNAAFVDACEAAISVENQAWMARWNRPTESE